MGPAESIRICVFVVTHGRAQQLRRCLRSLSATERGAGAEIGLSVRVLVTQSGQNGDPETEAVLNEFAFPYTVSPKKLNPAQARNLLLNDARSLDYEWAWFLDDDAYVEPDYLLRLVAAAQRAPDAAVIGGPNLTPDGSNLFQRATGEVLACRFANFLSTARYRPRGNSRASSEQELILCSLFVKRAWIDQVRFPEQYVCAEENRLLQELQQRGAELYYDPELAVQHDRRETPMALIRQVIKYGTGRGQNLRDRPEAFRFAYVGPSTALIASAILLLGALLGDRGSLNSLVLEFVAYFVLCLIGGAVVTYRRPACNPGGSRAVFFMTSIGIFPLIHFSYAIGVIRGLLLPR